MAMKAAQRAGAKRGVPETGAPVVGPDWIHVRPAATMLGVHRKMIYKFCDQGKLKYWKGPARNSWCFIERTSAQRLKKEMNR